jgi:hypothetical protein
VKAQDSIAHLDGRESAKECTRRSTGVRILAVISLSLAIYGMVEWIYVAVCSLVIPDVLPLPLVHLLPFLREDTSGFISFILSFLGFTVYRFLRETF